MFLTQSLGLCVCMCVYLSVCHHICDEMAGLSNMVSRAVNTIYLQELENATLAKMIRFRCRFIWTVCKKTFWAYNFKTYEQNHTKFYLYTCRSARGTACSFRILRSIGKSEY